MTQADRLLVRQTSQAQARPVRSAGSHSGCARANSPDVAAKDAGVTRPIGTLVNSSSITQRIRNERQNSSAAGIACTVARHLARDVAERGASGDGRGRARDEAQGQGRGSSAVVGAGPQVRL